MTTQSYHGIAIDQDDVSYAYGPDSSTREGVESGRVDSFTIDTSTVYPGTTRRVWVHVPAEHDSRSPAAAMVFNDGWWYLDPDGDVRAGVVLDNLAAAQSIPPMVGVFVDPGVRQPPAEPKNRNVEYDAADDRYASFLIDEVLPRVTELHALAPRGHGICGGSSGGNAAFTCAWHRSETFRRVIAFNPSFAQMPEGNPYPALLGAGQGRHDVRVLLHAAHRDIGWNDPEWNWFAESLETTAALTRSGHDVRLVVGDGRHSPNHGGVLLPDALRWLWS